MLHCFCGYVCGYYYYDYYLYDYYDYYYTVITIFIIIQLLLLLLLLLLTSPVWHTAMRPTAIIVINFVGVVDLAGLGDGHEAHRHYCY